MRLVRKRVKVTSLLKGLDEYLQSLSQLFPVNLNLQLSEQRVVPRTPRQLRLVQGGRSKRLNT